MAVDDVTTRHIVTSAGERVILKCQVTAESDDVIRWLRPGDNSFISRNHDVIPEVRRRMRIESDYSLLIQYVMYPQDQGVWVCIDG